MNGIITDNVVPLRSKNETKGLSLNINPTGQDRNRTIAAELNDGLAQWLVSTAYEISYCQMLLAEDRSAELKDSLQTVRDNLQTCLVELRRTISEFQPLPITELGLAGAINQRARQLKNDGVDTIVTIGDNMPRLTVEEENTVFGIVEEALTNIRQHADADKVLVEMSSRENEFIISISDNGRGFDINDIGNGTGLRKCPGFMLMESNAERLRGKLEIDSKAAQGTKVFLAFRVQSPMLKLEGV
jgi:two-component system sensor histidine kinase DegS